MKMYRLDSILFFVFFLVGVATFYAIYFRMRVMIKHVSSQKCLNIEALMLFACALHFYLICCVY